MAVGCTGSGSSQIFAAERHNLRFLRDDMVSHSRISWRHFEVNFVFCVYVRSSWLVLLMMIT
jgi:hypothetical protein